MEPQRRVATGAGTARAGAGAGLGTLAVCTAGICGCYLLFGILHEQLITGNDHNLRFGATFTLVTSCLTNCGVALLWHRMTTAATGRRSTVHLKKNPQPQPLPHRLLCVTSMCYVLAMICSNESIQYVSYPMTVLAKSCKLIPIMGVGRLVDKRVYTRDEWLGAALISSGILLFHRSYFLNHNYHHHHHRHGKNENSTTTTTIPAPHDDFYFGTALLLTSLFMDGLLSSFQERLKNRSEKQQYRNPSAMESMLYINLYSLSILIPLSMYQGQWHDSMLTLVHALRQSTTTFTSMNRSSSSSSSSFTVVRNLLLINAVVGLGQVFIFVTLQHYSSVMVSTITTTRKFFTILLSVYTFGHRFSRAQWLYVIMVFCGLYWIIAVQHQHHQQQRASNVASSSSAFAPSVAVDDDLDKRNKKKKKIKAI